jgi:hypothetical protein
MFSNDDGSVNSGQIEADIEQMEDFAQRLSAQVDAVYAPGLDRVVTSMTTRITGVSPAFTELRAFMDRHHAVQQATFSNTFNFRDGTGRMADAARRISDDYRNVDAFAHARLRDVNDAFNQVARAPTGTDIGDGRA